MDVPYLHTGRTNQKARTRDALIAAARQLLAEGVTPTVEEAAAEASVGRTTAYRYFPNSRALLAATFPQIEERSLLGPDPPEDPLARLEIMAENLTRQILEHEPERSEEHTSELQSRQYLVFRLLPVNYYSSFLI